MTRPAVAAALLALVAAILAAAMWSSAVLARLDGIAAATADQTCAVAALHSQAPDGCAPLPPVSAPSPAAAGPVPPLKDAYRRPDGYERVPTMVRPQTHRQCCPASGGPWP